MKAKDIKEMLAFNEGQVIAIATQLGYSVSSSEHITKNGNVQYCEGCGNAITENNLGVLIPGDNLGATCSNPACFCKYLGEQEY